MGAAGFDAYGILKLRGISRFHLPEEQPDRPIPGAFIAGGFLFGPGSIVSEVPYDPELYFYGERLPCRHDYGRRVSTFTPQIACCCFISTSQNIQIESMQPPIGGITMTGTSTTFAHSNVYTHCLAASTMPQPQFVALMIIQGNSNPLD